MDREEEIEKGKAYRCNLRLSGVKCNSCEQSFSLRKILKYMFKQYMKKIKPHKCISCEKKTELGTSNVTFVKKVLQQSLI